MHSHHRLPPSVGPAPAFARPLPLPMPRAAAEMPTGAFASRSVRAGGRGGSFRARDFESLGHICLGVADSVLGLVRRGCVLSGSLSAGADGFRREGGRDGSGDDGDVQVGGCRGVDGAGGVGGGIGRRGHGGRVDVALLVVVARFLVVAALAVLAPVVLESLSHSCDVHGALAVGAGNSDAAGHGDEGGFEETWGVGSMLWGRNSAAWGDNLGDGVLVYSPSAAGVREPLGLGGCGCWWSDGNVFDFGGLGDGLGVVDRFSSWDDGCGWRLLAGKAPKLHHPLGILTSD